MRLFAPCACSIQFSGGPSNYPMSGSFGHDGASLRNSNGCVFVNLDTSTLASRTRATRSLVRRRPAALVGQHLHVQPLEQPYNHAYGCVAI